MTATSRPPCAHGGPNVKFTMNLDDKQQFGSCRATCGDCGAIWVGVMGRLANHV